MICNSCGRNSSNESANFCDYCGASFKGMEALRKEPVHSNDGPKAMEAIEKEDKPISFLNWLGSMLLPMIPLVGPIVYLVMLLVWSFGSDANPSKKNWARATLLVLVISIVILLFLFTQAFMSILNSGVNIDEYMNQYYNQFY